METVDLLLSAASCEAQPNKVHHNNIAATNKLGQPIQGSDTHRWKKEIDNAIKCRQDLFQRGIDDTHRRWLARLVSTRRIVVVPTANALGYYQNKRNEDGIDPNRDFPYDILKNDQCMQTIASRTLNEIWREHLFQLSLTYHGGMEVIGYEWGALTWYGSLSPDDVAQEKIAQAHSKYGGGFNTSKPYDYGTMNDKVYYVRGGMEDWAYAGSFDSERVIQCKPTTFGGYDVKKTAYNNSTLRTFNMLVEASDRKTPLEDTLGTSQNVLCSNTAGNGHISRNIRLSLLSVDLVEPYVSILGVNDLAISDDVVPHLTQQQGGSKSCQKTKTVMVPNNSKYVTIKWTVGGALTIDNTDLYYTKWDTIRSEHYDCSILQPIKNNYSIPVHLFQKGFPISFNKNINNKLNGTGYFHANGPSPKATVGNVKAIGPIFEATIDLSKIHLDGSSPKAAQQKIVVIASATVDSDWANQPASQEENHFSPKLPPQSHLVNARTNADWFHESSGKIVKGRKVWFSMPLTIVTGDYQSSIGTQAELKKHVMHTIEVSNRFDETSGGYNSGMTPISSNDGYDEKINNAEFKMQGKAIILLFLSLTVFASVFTFVLRKSRVCLIYSDKKKNDYEYFDDEKEEYDEGCAIDASSQTRRRNKHIDASKKVGRSN